MLSNTFRLIAVFSTLFLTTLLTTTPSFADNASKITILHTNDNHGRFWHNRRGEYGMSARKTLIDKIRKEKQAAGSVVLFLSGGDINTGVP